MSTARGSDSVLRMNAMTTEKVGSALFVATIAFLAFVGGAIVVLSKTFPYEFLRNSYRAGTALIEKRQLSLDRFKTNLWREARTDARGITVHEPSQVFQGYTLYTSGDGPYARLISMDGRVGHEWRRPFSSVWNAQAAVKNPQPDHLIYLDKARVFPNGNLLAIYLAYGDTPWGYGMVKLNKDSELIWSYLAHTHHDFDIAPDGRIFLLTHEFTSEKIDRFERLERPRLDDFVVVLSPDGQELQKVSLTHALARSRYNAFLHAIPVFSLGDPLHTNTVKYISEDKAANFPFGKAGQVLLSFRDMGTVAVLDIEGSAIVWATRGPWLGQHDPNLLANGDILLFDNLGHFEEKNRSRVIEFDPGTLNIVWYYSGDTERPFESEIRSAAERLPNGNTLITESDGGRLFEVTRNGEIVWEYVNPVRGGERDQYIPVVSGGQRIDPARFEPEFRAMLEQRKERL